MKYGVSLNVAGGTHHAYAERGGGFCMFNDCAIATNHLLQENPKSRILIVDLDVHQGNGTAYIFKNQPNVFTFSMHGRNNYPFIKERSDCDIPLDDGIGDDEYLKTLSVIFPKIADGFRPDFIFYLAGVDLLTCDKLGKLSMTHQGLFQRDTIVFNYCKRKKIPVCVTMAGGYSKVLKNIIDAHVNTFKSAVSVFE